MYREVVPDSLTNFPSNSHGLQLIDNLQIVLFCHVVIEFCIELLITELSEALFYVVIFVLDDDGSSLICWFDDNLIIASKCPQSFFLFESDVFMLSGCYLRIK